MAPSLRDAVRHVTTAQRRDGAGNFAQDAAPMQPAASMASASSTSTYLGIGVGVGGALLAAIVLVAIQIARKRAAHKKAMSALGNGETVEVARVHTSEVDEVPRPVLNARRGSMMLGHAKGGWGTLGSSEEINEPNIANHLSNKKKRASVALPKRFRQKGMSLKRLKHLSVIPESPRSRAAKSPTPARAQTPDTQVSKARSWTAFGRSNSITKTLSKDDDVFVESPKPHVLSSHAICPPGRYGALFAAEENTKATRSKPVSPILGPLPDSALFGVTSRGGRPPMHSLSVSLGASGAPGLPPTVLVPALPVIAPHSIRAADTSRRGMLVSRASTSSQDSASSSVLVFSPILRGVQNTKMIDFPSVEQIVAEDDYASLKTVTHRQWQSPQVTSVRLVHDDSPTVPETAITHKTSMRIKAARYSTEENHMSREISYTSISSSIDSAGQNRLSIPQVSTADRMSISRVSSTHSFKSDSGVKKVSTPLKASRRSTTVSTSGSPAERRESRALRDISGNTCTATRKASSATQDSSRSSMGNRFQWDSVPMQKPSAMKGSPNARKGHRRQNCVRISTLAPHVLGPPPSKPSSICMQDIEEEAYDGPQEGNQRKISLATGQQLSRPPSTSVFAPNLRIQTLRVSLTPNSPTLSAWTALQEHGLPSEASDSDLSVAISANSVPTRSASRLSGDSSAFSIPASPSASNTTVAAVHSDELVPEFYFIRLSVDIYAEEERNSGYSPPFALDLPDNINFDVPSSPPLPVSKYAEYDYAWPMIPAPTRTSSQEYGPASPALALTTNVSKRSSPFIASTVTLSDVDHSPRSKPTSCKSIRQLDSPSCSPKSASVNYLKFVADLDTQPEPQSPSPNAKPSPPSREPFTSANASSVMANMPSARLPHLDFLCAPILPPPFDASPALFPLRPRSVATSSQLRPCNNPPLLPLRSTARDVSPPLHFSTNRVSTSPDKLSPAGPRSAPAKSVLENAQALRRMNSEIDTSADRQSRRYAQGLVREPSPLLPFCGSPDLSEGDVAGVFDLDFGFKKGRGFGSNPADAGAGASEYELSDWDSNPVSALDNVDMDDIERRLEGASARFNAPARLVDNTPRKDIVSGIEAEREQRSPSVWDDGEKFWTRQSLSTIPGSTPDAAEKLELKPDDTTPTATPRGSRIYTPTKWNGTAKRESLRSLSIMETPRSLYDAEGFLKS